MPRCSSCDEPIEWVLTQHAKKPMPVDPPYLVVTPDLKGTTIIVTDAGAIVRGVVAEASTPDTVRGRVSHFATCPSAGAHRSGR